MEEKQAKKKIIELRKTLEYHAKKYYDEDKPEISDFEYDMMMNELKDALWYVSYDKEKGFSFQNVYRIENSASSWLSIGNNFENSQQYLKLYKSIEVNPVDENVEITVDAETRNYQLYVPVNAGDNCPLVISLHGANGASTNYSPFGKDVADSEGCIVAYPQGKVTNFPIGFGGDATGWTASGEDNFDVDAELEKPCHKLHQKEQHHLDLPYLHQSYK